jgi:hypothetical protein
MRAKIALLALLLLSPAWQLGPTPRFPKLTQESLAAVAPRWARAGVVVEAEGVVKRAVSALLRPHQVSFQLLCDDESRPGFRLLVTAEGPELAGRLGAVKRGDRLRVRGKLFISDAGPEGKSLELWVSYCVNVLLGRGFWYACHVLEATEVLPAS